MIPLQSFIYSREKPLNILLKIILKQTRILGNEHTIFRIKKTYKFCVQY